jgi:hypothetical protein
VPRATSNSIESNKTKEESMNGTHIRLAVLVALSAVALVACGGGSATSPTGGDSLGDSVGVFTDSGNGAGNGGVETPAGDGVCDGCDGTCDGTGPHGPGAGNGSGDGTCDGTGQGPGPGAGSGPGDGTCACTCAESGPDPDDLEALLVSALQEEYLAEWTYQRVLADFGDGAMPFATIVSSERQHVQAIVALFAKRGWKDPDSVWSLDNVTTFDTLPAACAGGVAVELEDGELYDGLLAREDLPCDAATVFTNLRAASLENHLPAFERCQ